MKKLNNANLESVSAGIDEVAKQEAQKLNDSGRDGNMILNNRNLFDQSYLVASRIAHSDQEARNYAVATTIAVLSASPNN